MGKLYPQDLSKFPHVCRKKVLSSCHLNYNMPSGDETKGYEDMTFDEKGCREYCIYTFQGKTTHLDSCMGLCRLQGF